MSDLAKAAGLVVGGRLQVRGLRIREEPCMVVVAPKPDGWWLLEIEGVEGSAVLVCQQALVDFAKAILARARGQCPGGGDG